MGLAHRNPDGIDGTAYIGTECKLGSGGFTCPRYCACELALGSIDSGCCLWLEEHPVFSTPLIGLTAQLSPAALRCVRDIVFCMVAPFTSLRRLSLSG